MSKEGKVSARKTPLPKRTEALLMWAYAESQGSDNIIGLEICDNYLDFRENVMGKFFAYIETLSEKD